MAKNKNDYFKLMEQQVECCVEASKLLETIIAEFSADTILQQREAMHRIENKADELHHDILTRLSAEFITPIDQEDILHLVQIIDDVTDSLDKVVLDLYMFNVATIPSHAAATAKIVGRCVQALHAAVHELKNFKKPAMLRQALVIVNTIEGEADAAYVEAIHDLFKSSADSKTLISSKAIYESLEDCCNLCEHAVDVIEQIIIKNT